MLVKKRGSNTTCMFGLYAWQLCAAAAVEAPCHLASAAVHMAHACWPTLQHHDDTVQLPSSWIFAAMTQASQPYMLRHHQPVLQYWQCSSRARLALTNTGTFRTCSVEPHHFGKARDAQPGVDQHPCRAVPPRVTQVGGTVSCRLHLYISWHTTCLLNHS